MALRSSPTRARPRAWRSSPSHRIWSSTAGSADGAVVGEIGLPVIIRPAYILGGRGTGMASTPEEFEKTVGRTGFSRFVLVDELGNLTGYMHLKDVMSMPVEAYSRHPLARAVAGRDRRDS